MSNLIDRMDKIRHQLVLLFLVVFSILTLYQLTSSFVIQNLQAPTAGSLQTPLPYQQWAKYAIPMSIINAVVWIMLLGVLIIWLVFRRRVRKDAALREAVDDERVRRNWLKAFKFAFLVMGIWYGFSLVVSNSVIIGRQIAVSLHQMSYNMPRQLQFAFQAMNNFRYIFQLGMVALLSGFLFQSRDR